MLTSQGSELQQDLNQKWVRLEAARKKVEEASRRLPDIFCKDNVERFLTGTLDPMYNTWKPSSDEQLKQGLLRLGVTGHCPDVDPLECVAPSSRHVDAFEGKYSNIPDQQVRFWLLKLDDMQDFAKTCRFETARALGSQFISESGGYTLWGLLKLDPQMRRDIEKIENIFEQWLDELIECRGRLIGPPAHVNRSLTIAKSVEGESNAMETPDNSVFSLDTPAVTPATSAASCITPDGSPVTSLAPQGFPCVSSKMRNDGPPKYYWTTPAPSACPPSSSFGSA